MTHPASDDRHARMTGAPMLIMTLAVVVALVLGAGGLIVALSARAHGASAAAPVACARFLATNATVEGVLVKENRDDLYTKNTVVAYDRALAAAHRVSDSGTLTMSAAKRLANVVSAYSATRAYVVNHLNADSTNSITERSLLSAQQAAVANFKAAVCA